MENFENQINQGPSEPISETGLLSRLSEVTTEDIQTLKNNTLPDRLSSFQSLGDQDLVLVALLFKLSDDELKTAVERAHTQNDAHMIHTLSNKISVLYFLTGDKKYINIFRDSQKK